MYVNVNNVELRENNRLARGACESLEIVLKEAKVLFNDPANYVHEYFSDLKNKI